MTFAAYCSQLNGLEAATSMHKGVDDWVLTHLRPPPSLPHHQMVICHAILDLFSQIAIPSPSLMTREFGKSSLIQKRRQWNLFLFKRNRFFFKKITGWVPSPCEPLRQFFRSFAPFPLPWGTATWPISIRGPLEVHENT